MQKSISVVDFTHGSLFLDDLGGPKETMSAAGATTIKVLQYEKLRLEYQESNYRSLCKEKNRLRGGERDFG